MKPTDLTKDGLLAAVQEADELLKHELTTPSIRHWCRASCGPLYRENIRTRAIAGALHALARWRQHAPTNVSFLRYLAHHVHAAQWSRVIDPAAYAELRRILPRPVEPLRMYGVIPIWEHAWSEARRREGATANSAPDHNVSTVNGSSVTASNVHDV